MFRDEALQLPVGTVERSRRFEQFFPQMQGSYSRVVVHLARRDTNIAAASND